MYIEFVFRSPTHVFIQNYLELLDKLLASEITSEVKKGKGMDEEDKEEKLLCNGIIL